MMKKEIVNVSSENNGITIRAVNGIFLLQESWMTKRQEGKIKMTNSNGKKYMKHSIN